MTANEQSNENRLSDWVSKVPQVTFMFWVIKICATTVGETGGDALSMTLQLGFCKFLVAIILCSFLASCTTQSVRHNGNSEGNLQA